MTRAHGSKSLQAENQTVIQRPQGWGNSQKINPNFNLGFTASWFSGLSVIFKNKIKLRRQQTACSKEKQDDAFQDSFKKLLLPEKNCSVILRALETFGPHQSFAEVSEFLTNEREGRNATIKYNWAPHSRGGISRWQSSRFLELSRFPPPNRAQGKGTHAGCRGAGTDLTALTGADSIVVPRWFVLADEAGFVHTGGRKWRRRARDQFLRAGALCFNCCGGDGSGWRVEGRKKEKMGHFISFSPAKS